MMIYYRGERFAIVSNGFKIQAELRVFQAKFLNDQVPVFWLFRLVIYQTIPMSDYDFYLLLSIKRLVSGLSCHL